MGMYLGIDASTQGIKVLAIDTICGEIAAEAAVNFGADLPEYKSPAGFIENDDPLVRHANPLMWLDGLELALARLSKMNVPLENICGISGAAQQHGTVYVNDLFSKTLAHLTPSQSLSSQLAPCLARKSSPIWMDRSTTEECSELTERLGTRLQRDTGSPAIERFAGPQIRRFAKLEAADYEATATVHLVSSFLCSVLIGKNAPIDYGDGAGMNLLNLHTLQWDAEIAEATAHGLLKRLPTVVPSCSTVGSLHPYFEKFGLKAGIPVTAWTGDNPSSLVGTGAGVDGYAGISLGTSDTFFGKIQEYKTDPAGCGHVFGHPAGGFMSLICFSNGSLARERVKNECGCTWDFFDAQACKMTPPGNEGRFLLPYFEAESTPLCLNPSPRPNFDWKNASPEVKVRALLESQILSMRLHTLWLGGTIQAIRLTGGASKSEAIQQIIADIFQAQVEINASTNACALGAAIRAAQGAGQGSFNELSEMFCRPAKTVSPRREYAACYQNALKIYQALETSTKI